MGKRKRTFQAEYKRREAITVATYITQHHMDHCNLLLHQFHSGPPYSISSAGLDPTPGPNNLMTYLLSETAGFRYSKRLSQKLLWKSDQKDICLQGMNNLSSILSFPTSTISIPPWFPLTNFYSPPNF